MTAAPPAAITRDQFLAGVRASGVLSGRQFDKAAESLGPIQKTAREVADFLVGGDWLTRFQAERLLHGKTDGFQLGPYLVLDYLGKSASARIYRARHRTMNRQVAVHVLRSELTTSEAVREGIREQARLAARLAHPNVLTLLDVNTAGDRMYMVHEFVDGADLGATVAANGPLGVARACEFARQVALGLQHAHDKQTPHGRLTPAAVLVGRPGGSGPTDKPIVKVAGLGMGAFAAGEPQAEYTPPEGGASAAGDLFALGAVLHLLLVGRPPTSGMMCGELVMRSDVPASLTAVIAALLSKDPRRRPASAAVVADALDPFARDDAAVMIDFSLPSSAGPISAATLSGGWAAPGSAPVMTPLPPATPAPKPSPWANLADEVEELEPDAGRSGDTLDPVKDAATPTHTVRRRKKRNGRAKASRTRRELQARRLWWGIAGAVAAVIAAGACVVVLMAVLK